MSESLFRYPVLVNCLKDLRIRLGVFPCNGVVSPLEWRIASWAISLEGGRFFKRDESIANTVDRDIKGEHAQGIVAIAPAVTPLWESGRWGKMENDAVVFHFSPTVDMSANDVCDLGTLEGFHEAIAPWLIDAEVPCSPVRPAIPVWFEGMVREESRVDDTDMELGIGKRFEAIEPIPHCLFLGEP